MDTNKLPELTEDILNQMIEKAVNPIVEGAQGIPRDFLYNPNSSSTMGARIIGNRIVSFDLVSDPHGTGTIEERIYNDKMIDLNKFTSDTRS